MAREFAKKFYKSKAWLKVREAVLQRDHYLCVKCGAAGEEVHHKQWLKPENINDPNVTLNMNNLITLCKDCHHREHERNQFTNHSEVEEGLVFDCEGNLIEHTPPLKIIQTFGLRDRWGEIQKIHRSKFKTPLP